MIKKYGVYGKVEFVMSASIANADLSVDFSGGSITARGVIPASYTTNNPLVQKALEKSNEFKAGIVRLIEAIPEACDVRMAQAKEEAERARAEAAEKAKEEKAKEGATQKTNEETKEGCTEQEQRTAEAQSEERHAMADDEGKEAKTVVEVTCREDAVEYLKANFGYTSSKLRTKGAVEIAAEEHGISFVGL